MKFILFAALTLLLLVGCGESSSFFEDQDYSDVIPKKEAVDSAVDWTKLQNRNGVTYLPNANKPFTGYAKQSYDNDQVEVLARFADGYVVRLKQWQENGIPKWEVGYMAGKVGVDQIADGGLEELLFLHNEGSATVWYENGQKKAEFNWKDGRKNGLSNGWYEEGQMERESYWKNGEMDGHFLSWHENGNKRVESNWKDGLKNGHSTVWYESGQKKTESNWKDGQKNGLSTVWYVSGQKKTESNWKDGQKNGHFSGWFENGQKNWESYWKEGVKSGLWSGWYENGIKERESYWKDGVKVGLWNGWYKNGRKARETYWKNGKFISSVGWKPNGEKCPMTNVKDGNGEVVRYCEEGNELSRLTYKDGEPLED